MHKVSYLPFSVLNLIKEQNICSNTSVSFIKEGGGQRKKRNISKLVICLRSIKLNNMASQI